MFFLSLDLQHDAIQDHTHSARDIGHKHYDSGHSHSDRGHTHNHGPGAYPENFVDIPWDDDDDNDGVFLLDLDSDDLELSDLNDLLSESPILI